MRVSKYSHDVLDGRLKMEDAVTSRFEAPILIDLEMRRLLLKRIIPLSYPPSSWPTARLEAVARKLAPDRNAILKRIWDRPGWIVIDIGLTANSDDEVASAAWNLLATLCQPVAQYRTGELIHQVEVATHQISGASHYSQSDKSGGYHTDGTLLDSPPEIAMLAGLGAADYGGETVIVDGRRIVEELGRKWPAHMSVLEEEHPFHSGEMTDPVVTHRVIDRTAELPVIRYMRQYVELGYLQLNRDMPRHLGSALEALDSLTSNERYQDALLVTRGQALLWNNTCCLHGRKPFQQVNQRRRLIRIYGGPLGRLTQSPLESVSQYQHRPSDQPHDCIDNSTS